MATPAATTSSRRTTPLHHQHRHQHRNVYILACSIAFLALAQLTAAAPAAGDDHSTNNNNNRAVAAPATAVTRVKRMYALCPPHFERIGQQCYYVSSAKMNWLDAHFDCKDRNSQLAEPVKLEDRRLRRYMLHNDTAHTVKWIGGLFNWQKNQWQWGYSGRDMDYQSFSQMMPGSSQDLKFHCAVLNAALKYRWSAKPCVEKHNFVCQHNMPYVSERNRHKVYAKWNASYPNEMANEMVVILDDDRKEGDRRQQQRTQRHNNALNVQLPQSQNQQNAFKPTPRKREPFNRTVLIDSNGRFADRKFSQRLDFGAPNRRGPLHRRRPKTTAATTTATTTTVRSVANADDAFNSLDAGTDQRQREAERLAAEQRAQRLDAERRAKHKHDKLERQRQIRERRRKNELQRQQQHEQLMREHEQTVDRDRDEQQRAASRVSGGDTLTAEQRQREAIRMAETRRMLHIDGAGKDQRNDRYYTVSTLPAVTTTTTATTSTGRSTSTQTAATPTNVVATAASRASSTITTTAAAAAVAADSTETEAVQRERAEQLLRAEEAHQRAELERRAVERQRQHDEYERQERLTAEQRERERAEIQQRRDREERQRYEHEQRIQAEIREREEHEREESEREQEREREMQERSEREEQRRRSDEERRRAKESKAAEIRRLKEKSMRNNNDTVPEEVAAAVAVDAEQQKAVEKKRKRDKIKAKLMQMTPEQQMEFLRARAERQRTQKRQAAAATSEAGNSHSNSNAE